MVQIVPINDNVPLVTVKTIETYYVENAPPQPVLQDVAIIDEDEYCDSDQLTAARVQVDTITNDSPWDQLTVRIATYQFPCSKQKVIYFFVCIISSPPPPHTHTFSALSWRLEELKSPMHLQLIHVLKLVTSRQLC